jgi:hypothetical protein
MTRIVSSKRSVVPTTANASRRTVFASSSDSRSAHPSLRARRRTALAGGRRPPVRRAARPPGARRSVASCALPAPLAARARPRSCASQGAASDPPDRRLHRAPPARTAGHGCPGAALARRELASRAGARATLKRLRPRASRLDSTPAVIRLGFTGIPSPVGAATTDTLMIGRVEAEAIPVHDFDCKIAATLQLEPSPDTRSW